jgi:hypothetical protein
MMPVFALVCLSAAPELFDFAIVPAQGEGQHVFFAAIDNNRTADLVVQRGSDLHIRLDDGREHIVSIPEGVSAFDIYDISGDGRGEIIAIRGREILLLDALSESEEAAERAPLFEADSLYGMPSTEPYRQVLVKTYQQQNAILLPRAESLVAYSLDGSILGEFPNLHDAPRYVAEFTSSTWFQDDRMTPGTNLTSVMQESELVPDLPVVLQPPDVPFSIPVDELFLVNKRELLSIGFRSNAGKYAGSWDRIIVSEDLNQIRHAIIRDTDNNNTLVFMQDVPQVAGKQDWGNAKNGPVRQYPGRLPTYYRWSAWEILVARPDFNGDGFMDLILWNAPQPGMSVDSIMRTVIGRTWPIRFTIHLYSPDKQRFEPKPAHAINCKVPITWFLEWGPIHNLSLADFDGDGKTDIALSTDEMEYKVWLAVGGFSGNADWAHAFPEPVEEIVQTADLSGNGRSSILLRGEKNLYLLQAR